MPISPSSLNGYDFNSQAEKKIYQAALDSGYFNTSNRFLFHSLNLFCTGNKKIKGEVDFVYLDDDCILFLEVKGGQVKFDSLQNKWYVMGGTQEGDPFKQAYDSLFQTRDKLLPELFNSKSVSSRLVFGIGVLFPECLKPEEFKRSAVESMEFDPDLIYDYRDYTGEMSLIAYLTKIKAYWSNHLQFRNRIGISRKEFESISKYFRQDLHFKLPVSDLIKRGNLETKRFTNMQMYVLDNISYNPGKGNIIMGGPGTGKTLLAIELLRRSVALGRRTLLVCFNKNLAQYLKDIVSQVCDPRLYEIRNLHELFRNESYVEFFNEPLLYNKDYWNRDLPLLFVKHLKISKRNSFDYVIVDEGQDILNEYCMEALGKLIKGDLDSGQWIVFMDKVFQNIYNPDADEYYEFLKNAYPSIVSFLKLNCRNTHSTIRRASKQTGLPEMPCLRTDNVWNSEIIYHNSGLDLHNRLSDILVKLEQDGIDKKSITILCIEKGQVAEILNSNRNVFMESAFPISGRISISTIHSFKGLENEFVIIIGPDDYDPGNSLQMYLIYIANTRATSQSIFLLNRRFRQIIEDREDQNN